MKQPPPLPRRSVGASGRKRPKPCGPPPLSLSAGSWDWDVANGTQTVTPEFWKTFGSAAAGEPSDGRAWKRVISPGDLPQVLANLHAHVASRGQTPFCTEVRCLRADGATMWAICEGQVIAWGEAGEPRRLVGSFIDVTHLKPQSDASSCVSLVAEKTTNGVIITDGEGLTEWVNAEFTRSTGYHLHEVAGKRPGAILQGPLTDPVAVARIKHALAAKKPIEETLPN